jgi:hypothetical protein
MVVVSLRRNGALILLEQGLKPLAADGKPDKSG